MQKKDHEMAVKGKPCQVLRALGLVGSMLSIFLLIVLAGCGGNGGGNGNGASEAVTDGINQLELDLKAATARGRFFGLATSTRLTAGGSSWSL